MNKKILFAATSEGVQSGASRCYLGIVKEFIDRGIDFVSLVPKEGPMSDGLKNLGVKTYIVYDFNGVWQVEDDFQMTFINRIKYLVKSIYNHFAVNKIKNILIKEKIDIVHINSITRNSAALAAKKAGIPYVWHIRELLEDGLDSKFVNQYEASKLLNNANKIICISNTVNDYYKNKYSLNNTKVVYDGIDSSLFYCDKKILSNNLVNIGIFGRVDKQKRQDTFLKAITLLKEEYPKIRCRIIGSYTENEYYNGLKKIIVENGMTDIVEFTGFVSEPQKFLKECDIVCVCSYNEAFGLTTIESMLSGSLTIVSDSGCNKELVCDNKNGFIFKFDDFEDLAKKISYAIDNKKFSRIVADEGQKFSKDFTIKNAVDGIISCYKSIS